MPLVPEVSNASIVIVGDFSPVIFHPSWFLEKGLISEGDADDALIQVCSPEVTVFSSNWLNFMVDRQRMQIFATSDPLISVMDLAKNIGEAIPETPIYGAGINKDTHTKLRSIEDAHRLGDTLAPKEPWGLPKQSTGLTGTIGLRSITFEFPKSDMVGFTHIRLEPSTFLGPSGVFMTMNDHYEFKARDEFKRMDQAMDILSTQWQVSMDFVDNLRVKLLGPYA